MRETKEILIAESRAMGDTIGNGTPMMIHGKRFEKGTPVIEKMITILKKEEHFQPSFGPLKPLIKDHKMTQSELQDFLDPNKPITKTVPIRLTHKATDGPTNGLAEAVGPVFEAFAKVCKLSLTQASTDVAAFVNKYRFRSKPGMGALDVENAFWAMRKELCIWRIERLSRRFPEILEFFGISLRALTAVLDVIWEDNFFVAMGPLGPIFGRVLGCTMGNITSMPLCRVYYFCSLEEAIGQVGRGGFIYCKSGGDDALCLVWDEEDLRRLHRELNELPDGWSYEMRLPDEEGKLSFFDVMLERKEDTNEGGWIIETSVFFKPADGLLRTNAKSFWSWDHAEALVRSHLDRIAKVCSTTQGTVEGMRKLGVILARREHPLEQLFLSFCRLNPSFLAERDEERRWIERGEWEDIEVFGIWEPEEMNLKKRLAGTIPFGGPVNEVVKRITAEFLQEIARRLKGNSDLEIEVTVSNSPFKCLTRILPVAKICAPKLLGNNLVYKIQKESNGRCGIGQVGFRPVIHRLNEHFWQIEGGRSQYNGTTLNPFLDMQVCGVEENKYMRLALEAFEIVSNPRCVTQESINLGPWKLLIESLGNFRFLRGGGVGGPLRVNGKGPGFWTGRGVNVSAGHQRQDRFRFASYAWNVRTSLDDFRLPAWCNEYLFLPHNAAMEEIMKMQSRSGFTWKRLTMICNICNERVSGNIRICDICRRTFHEECWMTICSEGEPGCWAPRICHACESRTKELEYEGVPIDFVNAQRCFPTKRRWERIRSNEQGQVVEMDVSRCGPELADILVEGFAKRAFRGGMVDARTIAEHGMDRKPITTSVPMEDLARRDGRNNDDAKNKTYPASVFGQAREEFWNTFDGKGDEVFVEGTAGLMQHLLLSTSLGEHACWCTCELVEKKVANACFLHFFFTGAPLPEMRIDVKRLRDKIEEAMARGLPPLRATGLEIIPTPGTDNKCFFSSISISLFGSACWGSVLKARCAWWIRSIQPSEEIFGAWTESLGNRDREAAAAMGHLARLMSGMVESQDIRIVLAWAFCDLWVDVTLVSNEVDFSAQRSSLPSGRDTIVDLGARHLLHEFWDVAQMGDDWMDCEIPTFPQILIAHEGAHFSALRWDSLRRENLSWKIEGMNRRDTTKKRRRDITPIFLTLICDDLKKAMIWDFNLKRTQTSTRNWSAANGFFPLSSRLSHAGLDEGTREQRRVPEERGGPGPGTDGTRTKEGLNPPNPVFGQRQHQPGIHPQKGRLDGMITQTKNTQSGVRRNFWDEEMMRMNLNQQRRTTSLPPNLEWRKSDQSKLTQPPIAVQSQRRENERNDGRGVDRPKMTREDKDSRSLPKPLMNPVVIVDGGQR